MRSGDPAAEIGDCGDQSRPSLGRTVLIGAIVAARMEAQRVACSQADDATLAKVGFRKCARDRPGHGIETPGGLRGAPRRWQGVVLSNWIGRQRKERTSLL